jgi:hypothetical protein
MKLDKIIDKFVLKFVLLATLMSLAAIAVQAQDKPRTEGGRSVGQSAGQPAVASIGLSTTFGTLKSVCKIGDTEIPSNVQLTRLIDIMTAKSACQSFVIGVIQGWMSSDFINDGRVAHDHPTAVDPNKMIGLRPFHDSPNRVFEMAQMLESPETDQMPAATVLLMAIDSMEQGKNK